MNWEKISFILIVFLTFLGAGFMLSNVQSREADQLLEAHGLDNNTRYFYTNKNEKISAFLKYLKKKYPKEHIQLHLDNRIDKQQILVWSNHSLRSLPTQSGCYFQADDFEGQVSFAVLGPDTKKNVIERQGNRYILYHKRYYSVIGELKNYHQSQQTQYYLTTGVNQPTANANLKNYRIVIDSAHLSSVKKIAKQYNGKITMPTFVKKHQLYRFSVIREIILIILLWLVAMGANLLIALMQRKQVKLTHLKGSLYKNWLVNHGLRLILIESLLAIVAYILLRYLGFFSKVNHLILLLFLNWLAAIFAYVFTWLFLHWKEHRHA
ncbi:hypothetical protein B1745_03400 [Lactobacillus amylolyticus]|nr:hypothetical protein B1745_03400 [Lactobacillus amylolyticus]